MSRPHPPDGPCRQRVCIEGVPHPRSAAGPRGTCGPRPTPPLTWRWGSASRSRTDGVRTATGSVSGSMTAGGRGRARLLPQPVGVDAAPQGVRRDPALPADGAGGGPVSGDEGAARAADKRLLSNDAQRALRPKVGSPALDVHTLEFLRALIRRKTAPSSSCVKLLSAPSRSRAVPGLTPRSSSRSSRVTLAATAAGASPLSILSINRSRTLRACSCRGVRRDMPSMVSPGT